MRSTAFTLALLLSLSVGTQLASAQSSADANVLRQSYKLEQAKQYRQALEKMSHMGQRAQGTYFFALRRGWLQYLSGQYTDSTTSYARAARLAPRALEPLLGHMLPLMALRRWKDAAKLGQLVLRKAPQNYLAMSRVAWCEYNLGRFSQAAAHYQKLVEQYPADAEMRAGLGWALLKQGKKIQARRELAAALSIVPDHKTARSGLELTK